ncbi:cysteine-rich secretory protein family protein [Desulfosporosinus acididurans]|uniref:Cysteine-rich secretory protein family protein n=1 Tax=Desulfosporosinus acididurans TaxID=476652 RepID=A0A0J1FKH2_9FIRM|nr:CAP domain-containing protein [Desulfosporosinus acididurans]KLU63984.1 cysteine-rich secretory protein family protein [Desulfosporosinus acididurans]
MNKRFKVFAGIQMALLMTTIAMPAQAALLIGGSQSLPGSASGSVVTLRSTAPAATQVFSAPTTTTTASGTQSTTSVSTTPSTQNSAPTVNTMPTTTNSGSVVSLKNIYPTSIPSTSVTVPTSTQGTGTSTNYSSTPSTVQYQPVTVTIGQPSLGGSVVSLKNINQSSSSVPVTSTPPTSNTSPTSSSSSPTTTPTTPAIPAVTSLTPDEQQMVDMINQERAAAGVAPLKVDFRLVSVGQAKADDMKANNYFDHTSPTYGSPWAMMQEVGLTVGWAGENIAGNDSVSGAMAAFMQSPGHKANILDPRFTHVGVGIAYGSAYGNLYVQEFLQE